MAWKLGDPGGNKEVVLLFGMASNRSGAHNMSCMVQHHEIAKYCKKIAWIGTMTNHIGLVIMTNTVL